MSERVESLLDELVRLTALSIRRGMETQTEAILAFKELGLQPERIAELVGTTPATVRAAKSPNTSGARAKVKKGSAS